MVGIQLETLSKLIKVNNLNADAIKNDVNSLNTIIDDLRSCYSGDGFNFAFSNLVNSKNSNRKISTVVSNYSAVLSNVKIGYQKQDYAVANAFSHKNIL